MRDNFSDEIELEEDDSEEEEDEETDDNLVSDTFYIQQGQIKLVKRFTHLPRVHPSFYYSNKDKLNVRC